MRAQSVLSGALAVVAGVVFTATVASADNAVYEPRTKTVAGPWPVTSHYTVSVTSPSRLTAAGQAALAAGITTPMVVSVDAVPEGTTLAAAEPLISVSPSFLVFHDLSETLQVEVTVSAPAGTPVGDYVFSVQADPPAGYGWGVSSHTLSLTVSDGSGTTDVTPPQVVITAPTAGQSFTFCLGGTTIPVGIDAADPESLVTAIMATIGTTSVVLPAFTPAHVVSLSTTQMLSDIGAYTLSAWATSAGGTSAPVQQAFSLDYTLSFLPPLSLGKTSRGGSTMPIKFSARDCTGVFVSDTRVRVVVLEGATTVFSAVYGEGTSNVRIDTLAGHYITNFQTAAGVHTYTVRVYFGSVLQGTTQFSVR